MMYGQGGDGVWAGGWARTHVRGWEGVSGGAEAGGQGEARIRGVGARGERDDASDWIGGVK